jgi:hypothetical protein
MKPLFQSISMTVALLASLSAFAAEPATTAAPAATAATPVAPAAAAASAATATPADEAKLASAKVPAGYKVKVAGGETLYCRKDVPLGSRFPTEVCMTQAQYQEQERNRDSMRNEIQGRQKSYSINQ